MGVGDSGVDDDDDAEVDVCSLVMSGDLRLMVTDMVGTGFEPMTAATAAGVIFIKLPRCLNGACPDANGAW